MCVCLILSWSNITSEGSNLTPAHHYPDFRFKTYAPLAFRYFRDLFGIKPDDYLVRLKTWQTLQVIICVHAHNPDLSSVWITTSFVWSHAAGSKSSALSFLSTATEINLLVLFKRVKKGHFKFLLSRLKGKKKKGDLRKYAESLPVTDCLPSISLHITRINSLLFMRLNRDHFYKLVRSMTLDFDFLPVPASMQSSANCLLGAITSHST